MIVKVQHNLVEGGKKGTVLIYNRTRSHICVLPLTNELIKKMNGSSKCFFNADTQDGAIVLKEAVPTRNW